MAVCLRDGGYAMPDRFGFCLSSRPRFGREAVYAIALCGLAAASVAVLPAVIGAAKAESMMPQTNRVFELRVNQALPGKMPALPQTPAPGRSFRDCSNGCPETVVVPQVGSFPPNQFGLHDMLGNVMNWTEDCWNANYSGAPTDGTAWRSGDCGRRVVRGGSWDMDIRAVRSAMRRGLPTSYRNTTLGFRVARTL